MNATEGKEVTKLLIKVSMHTSRNAEKRKFNNDACLHSTLKIGHINGYFEYIQIQNILCIYTYLFNNISIFHSAPSLINFLSTQVILNIPLCITSHRWSYKFLSCDHPALQEWRFHVLPRGNLQSIIRSPDNINTSI